MCPDYYLISIQAFPWLHDANALIHSTEATQRARLGGELQCVFLTRDRFGGRELQGDLA